MNRLPLALCLLALLGAAASAVLFFRIGDSKKMLDLQLADAATHATRAAADLAAANEQNGSLKARASGLESELQSARAKIAAGDERAAELDRNLTQTKAVLALYEETSRALAGEVTALRTDLSDARASNASPEAVAAYKDTITELERQLASARNGAAATGAIAGSTAVFSSRAGRATVLNVGPESAFVVLNFGAVRGAQIGQRLNVSQGTDVVATVLISDVRPNFSIAQVLPASLRAALQKGDSALLLR